MLEKALNGYLDIAEGELSALFTVCSSLPLGDYQAARAGSLSQIQSTHSTHAAGFEADKTNTFVARLLAAERNQDRDPPSLAFISLRYILCVELHLYSGDDAKYIVGKAIRDGVIENRIVPEKDWSMVLMAEDRVWPRGQQIFLRPVGYCLELLHNQSHVKYISSAVCMLDGSTTLQATRFLEGRISRVKKEPRTGKGASKGYPG